MMVRKLTLRWSPIEKDVSKDNRRSDTLDDDRCLAYASEDDTCSTTSDANQCDDDYRLAKDRTRRMIEL